MRFSFVEEHKDAWPVTVMADLLGVSTAGFYAWRDRPQSERQRRRDALLVEIEAIHREFEGRYGSPRIHPESKADGHGCCVDTVAEVMRQAGIRARTARKFRRICRNWSASSSASVRRWPTPTAGESSTATSSPATSWSGGSARSR